MVLRADTEALVLWSLDFCWLFNFLCFFYCLQFDSFFISLSWSFTVCKPAARIHGLTSALVSYFLFYFVSHLCPYWFHLYLVTLVCPPPPPLFTSCMSTPALPFSAVFEHLFSLPVRSLTALCFPFASGFLCPLDFINQNKCSVFPIQSVLGIVSHPTAHNTLLTFK